MNIMIGLLGAETAFKQWSNAEVLIMAKTDPGYHIWICIAEPFWWENPGHSKNHCRVFIND